MIEEIQGIAVSVIIITLIILYDVAYKKYFYNRKLEMSREEFTKAFDSTRQVMVGHFVRNSGGDISRVAYIDLGNRLIHLKRVCDDSILTVSFTDFKCEFHRNFPIYTRIA